MSEIQYISYEETLVVYQKTIEKSGGGFSGIRDKGGIESVLDFVQNDLYYPDLVSKLTYLVFRFCSGHFDERLKLDIIGAIQKGEMVDFP